MAGVAGALAGAAVSADAASAASGDPLILGTTNDSGVDSDTSLLGNGPFAFSVHNGGPPLGHVQHSVAINATSDNDSGIWVSSLNGSPALIANVGTSGGGAGKVAVFGTDQGAPTSLAGSIGVDGVVVDKKGAGVAAQNESAGNGLYATTNSADTDDTAAVYATNAGTGTGVYAESNGGSCVVAKDRSVDTGAYGVNAQSSGGTAVYGDSTDGTGVWAHTFDGTALVAQGQFGTAIDVQGQAKFNTSGVATVKGTVATPKSSIRVNVTATTLTTSSLVLATIQTNNAPGVFVQSAVPNVAGNYFTINLNQAVTKSVKVAWFVVN